MTAEVQNDGFRFCPLCGDGLVSLPSGPDQGRPGCDRGHFVHYNNPAVTAFAFVQRSHRYLVLKRGQDPYRDRWELPGGFVEAAERPDETVSATFTANEQGTNAGSASSSPTAFEKAGSGSHP